MSDLKQAIQREYLKCASDPVHFMRKYCTIQHPKKGKIKFDLYDFQEKMVGEFKSNDYNIILKSRQLGISTLSAGYALWMMLFHNDKNILVIATGKDTAKNLVTKVRVMYHNLPQWLKTKLDEDNKLSLRFSNGSQIKAVAATQEAGRSEALSLLVLDEADTLLDLGFQNTIDQVLKILPKQRRTGLFSATQTKGIKEIARAGMRNPVSITVEVAMSDVSLISSIDQSQSLSSALRTPISLENWFIKAEYDQRLGILVDFLNHHSTEKIIVFV